jgi:hypothetical protein
MRHCGNCEYAVWTDGRGYCPLLQATVTEADTCPMGPERADYGYRQGKKEGRK